MATKKHLFSWTGYAATKCKSAVIANTAKSNIVLTFTDIKPFKNCVYTEFSVTGTAKTIDSRALSYPNKTVTLHVTAAYAFGNTCALVYNPPKKGATMTIAVTNNVLQ